MDCANACFSLVSYIFACKRPCRAIVALAIAKQPCRASRQCKLASVKLHRMVRDMTGYSQHCKSLQDIITATLRLVHSMLGNARSENFRLWTGASNNLACEKSNSESCLGTGSMLSTRCRKCRVFCRAHVKMKNTSTMKCVLCVITLSWQTFTPPNFCKHLCDDADAFTHLGTRLCLFDHSCAYLITPRKTSGPQPICHRRDRGCVAVRPQWRSLDPTTLGAVWINTLR